MKESSVSPGRTLSVSVWCVTAAFGAYFCMYGFRKPFTAASYADQALWGIEFKTILVTAQVLGYTLSKFVGIKVVSEVRPRRRAGLLLSLVGIAELALLLFALTPPPYNAVWLFGNGLALGMIFGLVLGFLEGRQQTETLVAGLCTSFILADGVTKSVGAFLLTKLHVPEHWMPFTAGLIFIPPLLIFVAMLARIPAPSSQDVAARSKRAPMSGKERWELYFRYATGLTLLVLIFTLVTILRSVRADFAPEIWDGLQGKVRPEIYIWSEMAVATGVIVLNGSAALLKDNHRAFFAGLGLMLGGIALVIAALVGLSANALSPFAFMVMLGLGLYLPYIAVHTTIFERLIAMTRDRGNISYLMTLADAFGYFGLVVVLLARNSIAPGKDFLSFFIPLCWGIAGLSAVLLAPCWYYFATHPATRQPSIGLPAPLPVKIADERAG